MLFFNISIYCPIFLSFVYRYFMIFLHPPTLRCCPRATSGCRSSGGISWADDTRSTGVPGNHGGNSFTFAKFWCSEIYLHQVFATEIHRNSYGCCTFAVKLWLFGKEAQVFGGSLDTSWEFSLSRQSMPQGQGYPMGVPEAGVPTDTNGLSFLPTKLRFFKWTTIWKNCL